jgi:peptidoglycan/xylan/chitin deacetylase (PgdA/CDA1 family)
MSTQFKSSSTPGSAHATRRSFLTQALGGAGLVAAGTMLHKASRAEVPSQLTLTPQSITMNTDNKFWPNGARLVISISMQFEAGGQPLKGTDSPFPKVNFPMSVPADLVTNTWFAYGYREGIPRLLDLWDRHGVKVTSHMIGEAVKRNPELAREIVARGHEAAAHGPRWSSQYAMSRSEERKFLQEARTMVEQVTGQRPIGYNCNWMRRSPHTLSLLSELGYVYHIDDLSRDEPFIEQVDGKDFVVVPYTLRNNDILLVEGRNYSPSKFLEQIKLEFDQLYQEAGNRRRMMSISTHDRIGGTPGMVKVLDEFLRYVKTFPDVAFMRKDEIVRYVVSSPLTLREAHTI